MAGGLTKQRHSRSRQLCTNFNFANMDVSENDSSHAKVRDAVDHDLSTSRKLEVQAERMRLATLLMALLGLACAIAAAELRGNPSITGNSATVSTDVLKVISTVSTAFLLLLLLRKYQLKFRLLLERGRLLKGGESFAHSGLLRPLLLELALCAVHCPAGVYYRFPVDNLGVTIVYDLDAVLSIVCCLRLYLVISVVDDLFGFRNTQARVVQSVHKLRFSSFFTFKAGLALYPVRTLGAVFTGTVLVLAYCLRVTERPVCYTPEALAAGWCGVASLGTKNFEQYSIAVWHIIITSTTIGYGDVFAVTHAGRVITILSGLFGITVLALLVNAVGKAVQLADHEKHALEALVKQQMMIERRTLAAGLVLSFLRYSMYSHIVHRKRKAVTGGAHAPRQSALGRISSRPTLVRHSTSGALGTFESELLRVAVQSGMTTRPDPTSASFSAGTPTLTASASGSSPSAVPIESIPSDVVRLLLRMLTQWRHFRRAWVEQSRSVSDNDMLARDLGDIRSELAEMQERAMALGEGSKWGEAAGSTGTRSGSDRGLMRVGGTQARLRGQGGRGGKGRVVSPKGAAQGTAWNNIASTPTADSALHASVVQLGAHVKDMRSMLEGLVSSLASSSCSGSSTSETLMAVVTDSEAKVQGPVQGREAKVMTAVPASSPNPSSDSPSRSVQANAQTGADVSPARASVASLRRTTLS